MPSGHTDSELDHAIIHTCRNSSQKHYHVTSVSWLCRAQSSTSPKSVSQDPLQCSECCSWRCYLWVSSVQSNIILTGQQCLEQRERTRTTMSSWSHGITAEAPQLLLAFTCVKAKSAWVLFVYYVLGGMGRLLIDLLSCVSRQFSVVFLY